jgi:hypothetical protein
MSTITLTENTTYSTLMILDGDTIDLAGYLLTIDSEPGETGISITSPGTAGTVTLSGGYDLSSWSMTAGTVPLVVTIPAGTVLGSVTAGSDTNARGCTNNYGTITTCTGGSGSNAYGCNNNYGVITTCVAGTGSNARGCYSNYSGAIITTCTGGTTTSAVGCHNNFGTITTCTGGSGIGTVGCNFNYATGTITTCAGGTNTNANGCTNNYGVITTCTGGDSANAAYGCSVNYHTITLCTGGSGTGSSTTHGCNTNNGLVVTAVGASAGSAAFGIKYNYGHVWNITDTTRLSVDIWYSPTVFVFGAGIVGEIKAPVATIYSFGAMNAGATLPAGATVTTLSTGIGLVFAGSLTGGFQ